MLIHDGGFGREPSLKDGPEKLLLAFKMAE
jgi:hypothetical protein